MTAGLYHQHIDPMARQNGSQGGSTETAADDYDVVCFCWVSRGHFWASANFVVSVVAVVAVVVTGVREEVFVSTVSATSRALRYTLMAALRTNAVGTFCASLRYQGMSVGSASPDSIRANRQPVSTEVEKPCPHQLPANHSPSILGTGPTTGLRSKELAVTPDQAASISTFSSAGNRAVSSSRTRC